MAETVARITSKNNPTEQPARTAIFYKKNMFRLFQKPTSSYINVLVILAEAVARTTSQNKPTEQPARRTTLIYKRISPTPSLLGLQSFTMGVSTTVQTARHRPTTRQNNQPEQHFLSEAKRPIIVQRPARTTRQNNPPEQPFLPDNTFSVFLQEPIFSAMTYFPNFGRNRCQNKQPEQPDGTTRQNNHFTETNFHYFGRSRCQNNQPELPDRTTRQNYH